MERNDADGWKRREDPASCLHCLVHFHSWASEMIVDFRLVFGWHIIYFQLYALWIVFSPYVSYLYTSLLQVNELVSSLERCLNGTCPLQCLPHVCCSINICQIRLNRLYKELFNFLRLENSFNKSLELMLETEEGE